MNEDQRQFLALLSQPPARFNVEQTAWALNCQTHDIPILVAARLLKPLGNPPPNGMKLFAALEIVELARDRAWLARATSTIQQYWQVKNRRRKQRLASRPTKTEAPEPALLNQGRY